MYSIAFFIDLSVLIRLREEIANKFITDGIVGEIQIVRQVEVSYNRRRVVCRGHVKGSQVGVSQN